MENKLKREADDIPKDFQTLPDCPFCGSNHEIQVLNVGSHFTTEYYAVYCDNCGATGPVIPISIDYTTTLVNRRGEARDEAIRSWINRAGRK